MYRENPEKAREIANKLASYKQHSATITLKDLLDLGVEARKAARHEI